MRPDSILFQEVQDSLRVDLPFICIASVVVIAGLVSFLLGVLRSRGRLLLWLGVFSTLYGVRLFVQNGAVHAAVGASDAVFALLVLCITYVIPIPYATFVRELLGPGWKRSITIWLWAEIAFALIAIPVTLSFGDVTPVRMANHALIISGTLLTLLHVTAYRDSADRFAKSLKWPLIIAGVLVLFANTGERSGRIDFEPFGFLALLGGLGYAAAGHALRRERQLVEVEQELAMARRIQSSIIPQSSPDVAGLSVASRYHPMTSVAGDFFDFVKMSETSLCILVADVSGHGVPAALVASMLKVCFAAQQKEAANPAMVLAGLNTMLRGSLGGQYVTAACAAIDLCAGTVTYSGAGHPPALLLRNRTKEVVQLAENGLFIGPFPNASYSNITVAVEGGDKLVLYTDGIVEASGPDGQEFGREKLASLLVEMGANEPGDFLEELFRRVSTPPQQDDLTAVVTRFIAMPARVEHRQA